VCTLDKWNGNIFTLSNKTWEWYLPVLPVVQMPRVMSLDGQPEYTYKEKDTDIFHLTYGSRLSSILADTREGHPEPGSNINGNTRVSMLPWVSILITLNTVSGM
jgi:hypothetical protein